MKLGTETGSLVNHLLAGGGSPEPEIGMGATELMWTDRHAGTIVEITTAGKTSKTMLIGWQRDLAIRTDKNGMSDAQSYEYKPNPNSHVEYFKKNKRGEWISCRKDEDNGRWVLTGRRLALGRRDEHHDFTF